MRNLLLFHDFYLICYLRLSQPVSQITQLLRYIFDTLLPFLAKRELFTTFASVMVYVNSDIQQFDLSAALHLLSPQRRAYVAQFRLERDRKLSAMAYLLLCRALREEYDIRQLPQFEFGPHGKPFMPQYPDIHFNISHCKDAVACVVCQSPVGIDVESVSEYDEILLHGTMNANEQQQILLSTRPDVEFMRLWTQKEAVLKYKGLGLVDDMHSVLCDASLSLATTVADDLRFVYSVCYAPHGGLSYECAGANRQKYVK